jgi:hypothetical protein
MLGFLVGQFGFQDGGADYRRVKSKAALGMIQF